ncbi:prolyl oligopeptidase family serine peptidase [Virgisporangium aurantiacum]|uniref:prolyl oligopeptidase n=1 Tax=Virgisporangium aurantiacum TaxID=175570 RepID=A0A8J3YZ90_9ACTN|nr:prolyl oligopeptidase family serine peptidase [Virgisporangium aurantiacum]GIJ53403.1 prolyl endopeptidase [Virgisporangium aurantiacum]
MIDYPDADRLDLVEDLHGHRVADPYRWLEDTDDPRTKEWSAAQDELFAGRMAELAPARERFRTTLDELERAGVVTAPVWRGDRRFLRRREPHQEHSVLLVIEADGTERVLIDPIALDPAGTTTLDVWQPSVEGDRLAYGVSTGGTEESELYVLDVATGEIVEGPIDRARHSSVGWLPGGEEYFFQRHQPGDEGVHHRRVYRHRVGTDPAGDPLVFGEGAERATYFGVSTSRDGRWLIVSASRGTDPRNDVWLADLDREQLTFVQIFDGSERDARAYAGVRDGRMYIWTDLDAPRGRLCTASPEDPRVWTTLIPEDAEAVLSDFAVLDTAGLIAVDRTRHAVSEVTVHDLLTGALVGPVELPAVGAVTDLRSRPEGGQDLWLAFQTFDATQHVLHWRPGAITATLDLAAPAPTPPPVAVRQVVYTSADGTPVRMFIVDGVGAAAGPKPTILYGYGGFNVSMGPRYWPLALAWVAAGGVFAVANLRGGSEEGEAWHRAGMLADKQNVFDDFHAAADWLVSEGVASSVGCYGGSNGGLLVGAALTQRPDRFAAVVCSAPLLDMVRYEEFGLGPNWSGEYGTASDPEQLAWLLGYSPYHRVTDGTDYPATMFVVFEGDTRVDPMHARKMAAAVQHATTGDRPILIRRETGVGHSARAVSRAVDMEADLLAFFDRYLRS